MLHQDRTRMWVVVLPFILALLTQTVVADTPPLAVPAVPTGIHASDGTYDVKIRITWNAVSGATYYYVDRHTRPVYQGSSIRNAEIVPYFDDRYDSDFFPPQANVTYYYWVTACNSDGCSAMGGPDSGWRRSWANASNTPFRLFKHWVHEGGISTPFIVRWPGATPPETIAHQPMHLIDIVATCVAAAGASYPKEFEGEPITPLEGESLISAMRGEN